MPILGSTGGLSARAFGFRGLTAAPFILQGNYDALATVTVPSGSVSSIVFSGIPQTGYAHLQIRGLIISAGGVYWVNAAFNGDTTAANYKQHELRGDGSSASSNVPGSGSYGNMLALTTNSPSVIVTDILDYTNTTKNKTVRTLGGSDANGSGYIDFTSGLWMNTGAINKIEMKFDQTGSFGQYSQFALYGVKA
jgi:hypothetical protein